MKAGAILGTLNKAGVNIFNHPVATKQLLFRLLDILSQEPRWGEGDCCEECLVSSHVLMTIMIMIILPSLLEQVRSDHQETPLPSLWPSAVFQVLGQGDAHHEIQPQ